MEFISEQNSFKINIEKKERFNSKLYKVEFTITTRFNIYESELYLIAPSIVDATKYANTIINEYEDKREELEITAIKEINVIDFGHSTIYTLPSYNKSKEIV